MMSNKLERGALVLYLAIMVVVLHCDHVAEAKNYMVGNKLEGGTWIIYGRHFKYYPTGMTLKIGDTLEFYYDNNTHNVVGVGERGYKECTGKYGNKTYIGGDNKIMLTRTGWYYFISTKHPKDCNIYGMKIAVSATK